MTRLGSGGAGRVTLGLVNAYDKRVMREPHRRAIARAGAVAAAFDSNLALFGFPFPHDVTTPKELAVWSSEKTTIGQDGRYFVELAERGRVALFGEVARGFPPQLGTAVATTSKPRAGRGVKADEIGRRICRGESFLLVFGLGPHGMPERARSACGEDFDVTDGGFSLETATAIGAVSAVVWFAAKRQRPE